MSSLQKTNEILNKVNRWLLVTFTIIIILTSFLNIVLRWFDTSLMFVDPLVRHLVFAMAFLGAIEATERSQNISIDILKRYLESNGKEKLIGHLNKLVLVVSIGGCLWLTSSAYDFVKVEMEYSRELFWGVHTGMAASAIPVGFFFIALKSFLKFALSFQSSDGESND